MNSDTVKGQEDDLAGQVQEGIGNLTGDGTMEARGAAKQVAGQAQKAYGQAKEQVRETGQQLANQVEQQPIISVMVAGVVGFALGLLVAKR